jgi:arylformamidase
LLTPQDFAHVNLVDGERLLIHTPLSELGDEVLAKEFAALSVELIAHLASLGYVLVGTDAISVDPYTSKTLDAHHALRRHHMLNLECITLAGVADGVYELIALPLKLDGACASPVRAILRSF